MPPGSPRHRALKRDQSIKLILKSYASKVRAAFNISVQPAKTAIQETAIQETAIQETTHVICGDFNTYIGRNDKTTDSTVYGLEAAGFAPCVPESEATSVGNKCLDNILVDTNTIASVSVYGSVIKNHSRLKNSSTGTNGISDHHAVKACMEFF